jgi:hypothetical protein
VFIIRKEQKTRVTKQFRSRLSVYSVQVCNCCGPVIEPLNRLSCNSLQISHTQSVIQTRIRKCQKMSSVYKCWTLAASSGTLPVNRLAERSSVVKCVSAPICDDIVPVSPKFVNRLRASADFLSFDDKARHSARLTVVARCRLNRIGEVQLVLLRKLPILHD